MTAEMFRSSPERVGKMRELFSDPTLAAAIVCLQDERPKYDAADNAEAVVSVRLLSRQFQHDHVINLLLSLAELLPVEQPEQPPTWGVDPAAFQQA